MIDGVTDISTDMSTDCLSPLGERYYRLGLTMVHYRVSTVVLIRYEHEFPLQSLRYHQLRLTLSMAFSDTCGISSSDLIYLEVSATHYPLKDGCKRQWAKYQPEPRATTQTLTLLTNEINTYRYCKAPFQWFEHIPSLRKASRLLSGDHTDRHLTIASYLG
jgi:hypothetical protein